MTSIRRVSGAILLLASLAGCGSSRSTINYVVSTESRLTCCRSLSYSTMEFQQLWPSRTPGEGVVVRIGADTVRGGCTGDNEFVIVIANNTAEDIYVPMSNELEGDRIKLYPWRLYNVEGRAVRLARQLQYNDLIDRTDAKLRFFRIPIGQEVRLRGIIEGRWLCTPPVTLSAAYFDSELNPLIYADQVRGLRGKTGKGKGTIFENEVTSPIGLRYDVVYTTLSFVEQLPVTERRTSASGDTTYVQIGLPEEPAKLLNATQQLAESNLVTLVIEP